MRIRRLEHLNHPFLEGDLFEREFTPIILGRDVCYHYIISAYMGIGTIPGRGDAPSANRSSISPLLEWFRNSGGHQFPNVT